MSESKQTKRTKTYYRKVKTNSGLSAPQKSDQANNQTAASSRRPVRARRTPDFNSVIPYLTFTIPGKPVGKQRTRSAEHSTKHVTPKKTRAYENYVGYMASLALQKMPFELARAFPTDEQVFLDLEIYHRNGHKPDSDNVVKAIEDGCSGILWEDDRHVLPRVQFETWPDANPRVEVRITPTGYNPGKKGSSDE